MPRTATAAVAVILVALGVVAGCASSADTPAAERAEAASELRTYLQTEIADPVRRDAALGLFDQMDETLAEQQADVEAFRAQVAELAPNKETTRQELLALYDASAATRQERQARLLDLHFRLREQLTDEEWPGFVALQVAVLEANMRRPREGAAAGVQDEEG